MRASLLVELFTEELPPKVLKGLGQAFAEGILTGMARAQLAERNPRAMQVFATPRRLAVLIKDVLEKGEDRIERRKLMPTKVAFGADGKPTTALAKRLEKEGASVSQIERATEGGTEHVFLNQVLPGVELAPVLQRALEESITKLPIPKVMSYQLADGATTVQFVRPVHGLLALHGDKVVDVCVLGLEAGRITHGHRFQGVKDIPVATADAYEEALAAHGKVIASFDDRRADIARQLGVQAAAVQASLGQEADYEALLDEVTALVEYPTVYAGEFDAGFLAVPQECLVLTMRANQKYFPLFDAAGKLTNRFLIVSNMRLENPKNIIEGNQRVIRPRLEDARFFFDQDRKTRLDERVRQLTNVVYHNKLGNQRERVDRVELVTGNIARAIGADPMLARRAAQLAKADLLTNMVGEFPELQGVMGRYYALNDGEPAEVANAIEQHYRPRFAGDQLPDSLISCALALADKLYAIAGIFAAGQAPTGDKDPFALRRQALGVIRILIEKKLDVGLRSLLDAAIAELPDGLRTDWVPVLDFLLDRARTYFSDQGFAKQAIEAVIQPFGASVPLCMLPEIVAEASRFISTEEGKILAEANKRITNILKKSGVEVPFGLRPDDLPERPKPTLFKVKAEQEFWNALLTIGGESVELRRQQRFAESLRVLSKLGRPTKSFFDDVLVNAEERDIRENRMTLLQHARAYMNQVAELSLMAQ